MTEYKPGDTVNVTITGVRIYEQHPDGSVTISAQAHDGGSVAWPMPPQAVIERVAPADWPPRLGDLWRGTRFGLWFAARGSTGGAVLLVGEDRIGQKPAYVLEHDTDLTLLHREGSES